MTTTPRLEGPLLAIDVGSSSVRAVICDRQGRPRPDTFIQRAYRFEATADGGATIDAEVLLAQTLHCIDGALAAAGAIMVEAVAVDTFVSNVLGVDAMGQPVTPLYTWSDRRGAAVAARLRRTLDPQAVHQRTGCYLHPSYWPVRINWLREQDPAGCAKVIQWLSFGTYLLRQITGKTCTSTSAASWSGLLNRHTLEWDAEMLAATEISSAEPGEISGEALTGLSGAWRKRWPQLREAQWFPAIGDGAASNLGLGCHDPARVALALGTSGAMRLIMDGTPERVPDGLFCYRIDADRSLVGGALSNVGNYYQWLRATLHLGADTDSDAAAAAIAPDGHGLTVLPYLNGERTPFWDSTLPTAIMGMTGATTPAEILRAGLEATAYGFWRIWERLQPLAAPDAVLAAGGGAGRSPLLLQMLADVLGQPIQAVPEGEATLRGAALFVSGEQAQLAAGHEYRPDMAKHAIYGAAIARQTRLLTRLREAVD